MGQYIGPLPFKCGHKWHVKKLISKDGKFQTGPSASYPAGLCKFLAELISSVLRKGENELQPMGDVSMAKSICATPMVTDNTTAVADNDSGATAMATDRSEPLEAKVDSVGGDQEFPPKPLGLSGASESNVGITGSGAYVGENAGQPIWVEWAGRETEFVDGFGLCSPNLYRPEQRGAFLRDEAKKLAKDVYDLVEKFVVSEIWQLDNSVSHLSVSRR